MSLEKGVTKIGFIGAGNMAQALGKGMIESGLVDASQLSVSAPDDGTLNAWTKWGSKTLNDNDFIFANCDIVILAVKPDIFAIVASNLSSGIKPPSSQLIISVMSGISISAIEESLQKKFAAEAIVRVMPNTPALVGAGCAVYAPNSNVTKEQIEAVKKIFDSVGISEQVSESKLDAFTGLSGSGPAYIYIAIEALSDGAVKMGIPRPIATRFAAQMVYGSAKMVLDTGRHPGSLKDDVCSPGGTTIAAVHALEKAGFRSALMDAVEAATRRAQDQGKESK